MSIYTRSFKFKKKKKGGGYNPSSIYKMSYYLLHPISILEHSNKEEGYVFSW